ncbi:helix-turn-helix domain-containing protein [Terrimonas pollutisoli]|uniref:helix-turn-helix domain-containing protein n=1 Tax=Terrimonas pollutisoli TaxID=3034147 RepID=UPI0023EB9809|nr:AraC family transcriptional regulator [Terrimonas sp. H1YJ31]
MEVYIKNMVCDRCIKSVTTIFQQAGVVPELVHLGVVELKEELNEEQIQKIKAALETEGFAWIDDQKQKLVDDIKRIIIELVHYGELDEMNKNLSDYLSSKLHKDYHYLSTLFSSIENTTVEQYFILQKIEKIKEWLAYNEFTLSEMAFKLGYSSVAHLSAQFKKVTGFTVSQFRQLKEHRRKPLDKV